MKERIEELIVDYGRKIETLKGMIDLKTGKEGSCGDIERLKAKKATYTSVITDLERLLKEE